MRKIPALILLPVFFLVSCDKKIKKVHFNGRAYMECDGSPIANEEVRIDVRFDAGVIASNLVATTTTNGNGDYSVIEDVRYDGSFETYMIRLTNQDYFGRPSQISGNSEESHNVHLDLPSGKYNQAIFHFKNIQPVDSNDLLSWFYTCADSSLLDNYHQDLGLRGTDIDTIIIRGSGMGRIYFKYRYIKNGVENVSPMQFIDVGCRTDANVDVFY